MSVAVLLSKSALGVERSTLQRKLTGEYATKRDEAEKLAVVFALSLPWMHQMQAASEGAA